jgi:hypothetical protein
MKDKDLYIFVRFGGVNIKKQKGYSTNPKTFHAPPASRGFYAMPKVAQEMFLVGYIGSFQKSTMPKNPKYDSNFNDEQYEEYQKKYKDYNIRVEKRFSEMRREFRKDSGFLWHHLSEYCERRDIIDSHGSWVKTSVRAWEKAFIKMSLNHRYGMGDPRISVGNINEARGIVGLFSKDHCEVFFDEKV